MPELNKIYVGDCLETMQSWPAGFVQTCVTSPPYWGLRDYGVEGQIGLEKTPEVYVARMVEVFREVRRVLRDDGTLWLNLADTYASNFGHGAKRDSSWWSTKSGDKEGKGWGEVETAIPANMWRKHPSVKVKDLIGIPWRVALALQADGWYLRSDIIWHKPNPMPENVTDRPTKAHEYIFLMTKSQKYFYDAEAIREKSTGQNCRSVWTVEKKSFSGAHFATFPEDLIAPCVQAGCPKEGVVLDPFMGAGTTALVAAKYNRSFIGCELNPEYVKMAEKRVKNEQAQGKLF